MDKVLSFKQGRVPLLISMPHAGLRLTPAVEAGLIPEAQSLPDTDWHIPTLYDFAEALGASTLSAEYSRFVIDLNRPSDDKPLYAGATTGLYPATLFDGVPLFREGQVPSEEERVTYLQKSGARTTAPCKKSWRASRPSSATPCCLMRTRSAR